MSTQSHKILDGFDIYGQETQRFTWRGSERIYSICGLQATFIHTVIILAFFVSKIYFVAISYNPNIAVYTRAD